MRPWIGLGIFVSILLGTSTWWCRNHLPRQVATPPTVEEKVAKQNSLTHKEADVMKRTKETAESAINTYQRLRASAFEDQQDWLIDIVDKNPGLVSELRASLQTPFDVLSKSQQLERMTILDMLEDIVAAEDLSLGVQEAAESVLFEMVHAARMPMLGGVTPENVVTFAEAYDALEILARNRADAAVEDFLAQRGQYPERFGLALAGGLMDAGWSRQRAFATAGI